MISASYQQSIIYIIPRSCTPRSGSSAVLSVLLMMKNSGKNSGFVEVSSIDSSSSIDKDLNIDVKSTFQKFGVARDAICLKINCAKI